MHEDGRSHQAEGGHSVALAYQAALARRSAERGLAVQQALQRRLQAAEALVQVSAAPLPPQPAASTTSPLAQLLSDLHALANEEGMQEPGADRRSAFDGPAQPGAGRQASPRPNSSLTTAAPELRALRRAGTAWAQLRVQQQVRQSLAKAPEQAGPLNSHALVLRTLQALQALSPAYLLRFMQQMDTLFVLQALQLRAERPAPAGKPGRRASVHQGHQGHQGRKPPHSPR